MNVLIYLLQVAAYSGILWLIYLATFRGKSFHRGSRVFLLIASILPLMLPFVQLNISSQQPNWLAKIQLNEILVKPNSLPQNAAVSGSFNWLWIYAFIAFAFLLVYAFFYAKIFLKIRSSDSFERIDGISVQRQTGMGPGSFWNIMFFPLDEIEASIFKHEAAHIRSLHRYDLLLLQILTVLFWANPFSWILLQEIKMVHEFEADEIALANTNVQQYSELLLSKSFGAAIVVAHSFFHHPLKRRIIMLQKKSNLKTKIASVSFAAILALGFSSSVLYAQQKKSVKSPSIRTSNDASAKPTIYKFVEKMPKSKEDFQKFLNAHLSYPDSSRAHNEEGRSIIQFVVNEKGEVVDPRIVRSSGHPLLDQEAKRVVSMMPAWTPGEQDGKKVAVYFTLPITFQLEDKISK